MKLFPRRHASLSMALAACCASALADVSVDYSLGYDYFSGTSADPAGPVSTLQSRTYSSAQGAGTTVTGYARAGYGVLKTRASSRSSPSGPGAPANVNAYFADSIVFSSDALNGQGGFATIPVTYDWALNTAGAAGNVVADLNIRIAGATAYVGESRRLLCSTPTNCETTRSFQRAYNIPGSGLFYGHTPESVVPITIPIVFGKTYSLQVRLGSFASSSSLANLGGEGESDASHSYYWGGISAITDASGHAVSAVVSSASGTDYLNAFTPAVPEPTCAALLMAGLGVVGALRRRRQIRPAAVSRPHAHRLSRRCADPRGVASCAGWRLRYVAYAGGMTFNSTPRSVWRKHVETACPGVR